MSSRAAVGRESCSFLPSIGPCNARNITKYPVAGVTLSSCLDMASWRKRRQRGEGRLKRKETNSDSPRAVPGASRKAFYAIGYEEVR